MYRGRNGPIGSAAIREDDTFGIFPQSVCDIPYESSQIMDLAEHSIATFMRCGHKSYSLAGVVTAG